MYRVINVEVIKAKGYSNKIALTLVNGGLE